MTPPPLRQAIEAFRANDLSTILRTAGVNDVPKFKDEKVALWAKLMADPKRIQTALNRINGRCRKALEVLQRADGELRTERYRLLLTRAGIVKEPAAGKHRTAYFVDRQHPENAGDPKTFAEVLAALLKYGLIWTHTLPAGAMTTTKIGFEGGRFVYIPSEVAAHLPPVTALPHAEPPIAHVLPGSARTCQRDLYLLWSAAREAPLQLTSAELLRAADVKRLCGQLLVPETYTTGSKESDFRRIFFLRRLLMALGLLVAGEGDNAGVLSAAPDMEFWEKSATERVQACYQSWRDGAWWHELWATYVAGSTRASGSVAHFAPNQVVKARRTVLDLLTHFARKGAEWIALDTLSDYLRDHDEEFLVDRTTAEQHYSSYYYYSRSVVVSPYQQNALGWAWEKYAQDPEAGWDGVEGAFIRAVLTEGLYWLGLVDLGYLRPVTAVGGTAAEGLQAVRLTDMGRWLLLGAEPPAIPAETGRVVVQPNFRIFAFDPISDAVLARLDSFATRLNAERAVEYELTAGSVYRGLQNGQQVPEIIRWLESTTGAALPQNVLRSLVEWQAAFERILVRPRVGWVQTATAELADRLVAEPDLREAVIKRVDATSLMVLADKVDLIERRLLAAGELPVRAANAEEAQRASITLTADGAIRFVHAVPSLYVYSPLFLLADQTPDGWRITSASVRRACSAGLDATRIIARLESLALDGVPAELQTRIKAWGKYYGDAVVQTLTLVQFRDQAVVNELCAESALAPYMQPFMPAANLGLAVVRSDDLAALRALLAERGVEIK